MNWPALLACDLDRTLLPNGPQPEPPGARERFRRAVRRSDATLVYVTGRHLASAQEAITAWALPPPHWLICDVGTSLYARCAGAWQPSPDWAAHLACDWPADMTARLRHWLADVTALRPQAPERQGRFKLSYALPAEADGPALRATIRSRLADLPVRAVWSEDETQGTVLLDLLPPAAGKRAALAHLAERLRLTSTQVLFAGDSGNDIDLLTSDFPAVLVGNATRAVRKQADTMAQESNTSMLLYFARSCYAAGIIEGWEHYSHAIPIPKRARSGR